MEELALIGHRSHEAYRSADEPRRNFGQTIEVFVGARFIQ
jgi:hypothetical protein